jgi:hypothetical protein
VLVWTGAEYLAPPGFDPRTVQPVASHNTYWAIPAPVYIIVTVYINMMHRRVSERDDNECYRPKAAVYYDRKYFNTTNYCNSLNLKTGVAPG